MFEPLPLVVDAPGDVPALADAAELAATTWGLDPPRLVRLGSNGVFECGDVILRVGRATAPMGVAIRLADRLAGLGIRVNRPARHDWIDIAGGLAVTAWHRIDLDPALPVDWEQVGAMVATVHAIDPATVDHPLPYCGDFPWWDVAAMLPEAEAPIVDAAARRGMVAALAEHGWWIDDARRGPLALCHGDVHAGNVLVDASGPVLVDWDLLCVGPTAWDHSALLTWSERWGGEPGVYDAFAVGYARAGGAPIDRRVATAIAQMRLLIATLMRLRRARFDPTVTTEAVRRLAYWRGDPDAPQWQAQ